MITNLLGQEQGIARQNIAVQIGFMHIHRSDLMILVGSVVVNAFGGVAAGGVQRYLILTLRHLAAAPLLVYRAENVEKLDDALQLAVAGKRI